MRAGPLSRQSRSCLQVLVDLLILLYVVPVLLQVLFPFCFSGILVLFNECQCGVYSLECTRNSWIVRRGVEVQENSGALGWRLDPEDVAILDAAADKLPFESARESKPDATAAGGRAEPASRCGQRSGAGMLPAKSGESSGTA